MNRAARRKLMKNNPSYRKALKTTAKQAVNNLEEMFKVHWNQQENDATLNCGEYEYGDDDEEDNDFYND